MFTARDHQPALGLWRLLFFRIWSKTGTYFSVSVCKGNKKGTVVSAQMTWREKHWIMSDEKYSKIPVYWHWYKARVSLKSECTLYSKCTVQHLHPKAMICLPTPFKNNFTTKNLEVEHTCLTKLKLNWFVFCGIFWHLFHSKRKSCRKSSLAIHLKSMWDHTFLMLNIKNCQLR